MLYIAQMREIIPLVQLCGSASCIVSRLGYSSAAGEHILSVSTSAGVSDNIPHMLNFHLG